MFISDRLGGHNSGDIEPVVSRHKNSTVKHVCSVDVLSYSGATVSMETSQMVLNSLQSVSSRQMNSDPPRQKIVDNWSIIVKLFHNIIGVRFSETQDIRMYSQ